SHNAYGVYNTGSSSPTMTDVIATASGASTGLDIGVFNQESSAILEGVTAKGSGASNNYGVWNTASTGSYTVKINHSQITGSTGTVLNDSHFTTLIGGSLLDGVAPSGGGTLTCAGVWDGAYAFHASTCS